MSCATISGFAYSDVNNNGLLDAGESVLPNTHIVLKNGDGVVVGATDTDSNGFYQFDTDATVDTSEHTLTHSFSVSDLSTDWIVNKSVPQFDPSLGTLLSVEVRQSGTINSDIAVENRSTISARTLSGQASGTITLSGVGFNLPVSPVAIAGTFNATRFDGIDDFAGTSGHDFGVISASASTSLSMTDPAILAQYTGLGSVNISQYAQATSAVTGGGNLHTQVVTTASADYSVIYHYIPNNCLQPGSYTLHETQPSGYLDGQETAGNVSPIPNSAGGPDDISVAVVDGVHDYPNNNFGELLPASLGDRVWFDANENGVQDAGEAGVPDVLVTLSNGQTATTDSDGNYLFSNLAPGSYSVTFTAPDDFTFTSPNASSNDAADSDAVVATGITGFYTLAAGEFNPTVDAGLVPVTIPGPPLTPTIDIEKYVNTAPTPLGGEGLTPGFWKQSQHFYAWTSPYVPTGPGASNYDAVFGLTPSQDDPSLSLLGALGRGGGGKAALGRHAAAALLNAANPNVSYLYSTSQIIALVQNAYATGDYETAKNLLAAQNELEADLSTPAPSSPTPTGYGYDADTVGSGPTVLAGTQLTFTFVVTNPGQTPLMNVVVTDDNATPTNTADDFHPTYVSGDTNHDSILDLNETWIYTYVTAALAGSHTNTATVVGTNVFNSAQQVTDADAANYDTGTPAPPTCPAPASLAGNVYYDKDNDGAFDSNESGIANVLVTLTGTDDLGHAVTLTTHTNASGAYAFTNLRPGTYSVAETQPSSYNDGKDTRGTGAAAAGSVSNDLFSSVVLVAGNAAVNYNFGELLKTTTPPCNDKPNDRDCKDNNNCKNDRDDDRNCDNNRNDDRYCNNDNNRDDDRNCDNNRNDDRDNDRNCDSGRNDDRNNNDRGNSNKSCFNSSKSIGGWC